MTYLIFGDLVFPTIISLSLILVCPWASIRLFKEFKQERLETKNVFRFHIEYFLIELFIGLVFIFGLVLFYAVIGLILGFNENPILRMGEVHQNNVQNGSDLDARYYLLLFFQTYVGQYVSPYLYTPIKPYLDIFFASRAWRFIFPLLLISGGYFIFRMALKDHIRAKGGWKNAGFYDRYCFIFYMFLTVALGVFGLIILLRG